MERLEEELTCALCRDIFSEPRLLPCSHTFCGPCLRALPPPGPGAARPRCPTCRAPLALPAAGPQALPRNFAIQAVIDKWRRQQEPPGDGAGAGDGVGTCSAHPRQPLNVYCLQDQQLVCGQCLTVGEHRGHPIDDLQSAHSKGREAWGRLRQELQEPSRAEELAQRLKEQRGLCLCALDSDREAVRRYFKEVGDVLEHQKTALLSQLDELEGQIFEKYNPLLEEVEKLKLEESELKELHGAVQEEAPVRFLKELPGLKLRLHSLKQRQLPEPEALEIRPRIEKVLHERCKTELGQLHTIPTPKLYLAPKGKYTWKEILMAVWETLNQRPWLE